MPSPNQKNNSGRQSSQFIFALSAILVAVVLFASPVANVVLTARRAASSVCLGEIVKAYGNFTQATNPARMLTAQPGDTVQTAAVTLARSAQLNDAVVWFVKTDPKLNGDSVPSTIITGAANAAAVNPDFANKTLSYEIAANLNLNPQPPIPPPNPSSTPVAWTRGLGDDGIWAPDSPWLGDGGHIAFLDGHVEWFSRLSTQPGAESLYKYGTNTPTNNIREALPPGAIVLNAEPSTGRP